MKKTKTTKRARKPNTPVRFLKELTELAVATTSNKQLLSDVYSGGLSHAMAGKLSELNSRPIAQERGFRAKLVAELALVHAKHELDGNPPPRNSVDRWLDGVGVPSVAKYLLIAVAFAHLEEASKRA